MLHMILVHRGVNPTWRGAPACGNNQTHGKFLQSFCLFFICHFRYLNHPKPKLEVPKPKP